METKKEIQYLTAQEKVLRLKTFYFHIIAFIIVNLFLLAIRYFTLSQQDFYKIDTFYTLIIWASVLALHSLIIFITPMFLNSKWEEKKIRQLLNKN